MRLHTSVYQINFVFFQRNQESLQERTKINTIQMILNVIQANGIKMLDVKINATMLGKQNYRP